MWFSESRGGYFVVTMEEEQQEMMDGGFEELNEDERHLQKHRELFLSRQVDTVPATHIRGKCSVTLLNETESVKSYLQREVIIHWFYMYLALQLIIDVL